MELKLSGIVSVLILIAALCPGPGRAAERMRYITIGSGDTAGVYYPAAAAIGRIVNRKRKEYGVRVMVKTTGGSVDNINGVLSGDLEFGVAQSDRQYQAVHGLAEWRTKGPQRSLRAMFSLHSETFFLVATEKAGVHAYPDLKNKAVGVGAVGSGERQNFSDVISCYGLTSEEIGHAEGVAAARSLQMLREGRLDAFAYTVGNPAALIKEAASGQPKVEFLSLAASALNCLTRDHPYYVPAVIPIRYYPKAVNKQDVPTFAVKATFVTSAEEPEDIVYAITKELFLHLDEFKKQHRAFSDLTKKNMLLGLTAPLHPGSIKYYREAGLM